MSSDLNLLFGFLAVQNGFVREEALVRATNTWTGSKNRTIGEILLEQGAIRRDQLDLLNALVKEKLLQNDNDVSKTLAGLSSVDGARQAVARISDEDVQHTMTQMGASRSVAGPGEDTNRMADAPARPAFNESATGVVDDDFTGTRTAVTSAPDFHGTVTGGSPPEFQGTVTGGTNAGSGTATPQQVFGHQTLPNSAGRKVQPLQEGRRFRIIRPHAKGGLGEVFLAKDQDLGKGHLADVVDQKVFDHRLLVELHHPVIHQEKQERISTYGGMTRAADTPYGPKLGKFGGEIQRMA